MQPFGAFCAGSQFLVQPCPTDREVLLPTRSNWNYLSSDTSEKHVPRWIIWEVYSLSHISHDEWLWPCFYNSALQKTSNKPRHSTSPESKAAIELLTLRVNNVGFPNIASGDSFSKAEKHWEAHRNTCPQNTMVQPRLQPFCVDRLESLQIFQGNTSETVALAVALELVT